MTAPDDSVARACAEWTSVFTRLGTDGVPSPARLEQLTTEDVHFRDPFNDLRGREALRALLMHTLKQVRDPRFVVKDTAISGHTAYVKWEMTGRIAVIGGWKVTGMSELQFARDGRLKTHLDYWDAATDFYARLPVLGAIIRFVASKASPPKQRL
jgi:steroid delta-isomerase